MCVKSGKSIKGLKGLYKSTSHSHKYCCILSEPRNRQLLTCSITSRERSLAVALLLSGDKCGTSDSGALDVSCSGLGSGQDAPASSSTSKSQIFLSRLSSHDLLERKCFTNLFKSWTSLSSSILAFSKDRRRPEWRSLASVGADDLWDKPSMSGIAHSRADRTGVLTCGSIGCTIIGKVHSASSISSAERVGSKIIYHTSTRRERRIWSGLMSRLMETYPLIALGLFYLSMHPNMHHRAINSSPEAEDQRHKHLRGWN